jgi:hypothetical protein
MPLMGTERVKSASESRRYNRTLHDVLLQGHSIEAQSQVRRNAIVVIDKLRVTLVCTTCNSREQSTAFNEGQEWTGFDKFRSFDVTCTAGGYEEPSVIAATCKRCGKQAEVSHVYC